jgi:hypothetical protein
MAKTLQAQGVPIPSKLNGPNPGGTNAGPQSRSAAPSRSNRGTATQRKASVSRKSVSRSQPRDTSGPGTTADTGLPDVSSQSDGVSVGLLEAEFLTAIGILVLLMFSDTSSSITDKMMSVMKRGTLICAVFFILAIVSGIGPNAAKSAKAFGALVIVAILVTSPMATVLKDLDGIIKNDWIGAVPSSTSGTGSGDTATQNQSTPASDALGVVEKAVGFFGDVENTPFKTAQTLLGAIGIHI